MLDKIMLDKRRRRAIDWWKSGGQSENLLLIMGGQSNMGAEPATGRLDYLDIPSYLVGAMLGVKQYDNSGDSFDAFTPDPAERWGLPTEILYAINQTYTNVYFVKEAQGARYLADPPPATKVSYDFATFKTYANNAIANLDAAIGRAKYDIVVLWQQGESDSTNFDGESWSLAYEANLIAWFTDIRANVLANVPIVYSKLAASQTYTYLTNVQDAQIAVELLDIRNILISDMSEIDTFDAQHYDVDGVNTLATKFKDKIVSYFDVLDISIAPFKPTSISSLEKWSSPSTGESNVTTNGGVVTVLKDRSGNGYDGTGVNSPTHNNTTKLITFVEASLQQVHFNSHVSNIVSNTQGEIFIVLNKPGSSLEYFYSISDVSINTQFFSIWVSTAEKVVFNMVPGSNNIITCNTTTIVVGTTFILSLSSSGSAYKVEINGVDQSFSGGTNNGVWLNALSGVDAWAIGGLIRLSSTYGDIKIGDDFYFSQQLTTQQRADMFTYLSDIYE